MTTTFTESKRQLSFATERKTEPWMDEFGRPCTKEFDIPAVPPEQHKCTTCGEPATCSCTDARETALGWVEESPRYGCRAHYTVPMIYPLRSREMTAQEYERQHAN